MKSILIIAAMAAGLVSFCSTAFSTDLNAALKTDTEAIIDAEFEWLKAETIIWSASKYSQKVSEAPSLVSIIQADDIKKFGYRTLADILRSVSGFYVSYDRNYHYIGVRGFKAPGDLNSKILLLIDGHRTNDSIYEQSFIGTDFALDVDLIDRVEITRGPGSCLYGTNAFFGVINVITKKGKHYNGFQGSAEIGTQETWKTRLSYGAAFPSGADMLLSATYFSSHGNDHLYYSEFDDPAANNGVVKNKDQDRAEKVFCKASFSGFTLSAAHSSRKKSVPTAAWDTVFNEDFTTRDARSFIDLKYDRQVDDSLTVSGNLFYDRYTYQADYPYAWDDDEVYTNKDDDIAEWVGGEIRLSKKLGDKNFLTIGAELQRHLRQDMFNYDPEPYTVWLDKQRDSTNWAVYGLDELRVLENFIVSAGVRYDHYEDFGGSLNPRFSMIYSPFRRTTLKLVYGTAFRAPNAYELYVDAYNEGNISLDPEKISTYELIVEQNFHHNLQGYISGFVYQIDGLISQAALDDSWTYQNSDDIEARGLEAELQGRLENGVRAWLNYTFQHARNKNTDEKLFESPAHLVKAGIVAPIIAATTFGSIEGHYMSERKSLAGGNIDDHVIFNATLLVTNWIKRLELSCGIYNLFDRKFDDAGAEQHLQEFIQQDGLSFRLKATYTF